VCECDVVLGRYYKQPKHILLNCIFKNATYTSEHHLICNGSISCVLQDHGHDGMAIYPKEYLK